MRKFRKVVRGKRGLLVSSALLLIIVTSGFHSGAEPNCELDYQDPAGDVLDYNETWHMNGTVDIFPQVDLKWLKSYNDSFGNVVMRLEVKNNQVLEKTNSTRYVFRILTSEDNSTGYNITYKNGTTTITNFNETVEDDLTPETSIIDDNGEVLLVNISKNDYLSGISYFNIDAFSWKETGNHTYIDYVSEIPGHPGETGNVVNGTGGTEGAIPYWLWILVVIITIVVVLIIVVAVLKR